MQIRDKHISFNEGKESPLEKKVRRKKEEEAAYKIH